MTTNTQGETSLHLLSEKPYIEEFKKSSIPLLNAIYREQIESKHKGINEKIEKLFLDMYYQSFNLFDDMAIKASQIQDFSFLKKEISTSLESNVKTSFKKTSSGEIDIEDMFSFPESDIDIECSKIYERQISMLKLFLARKCDINQVDLNGNTPLHVAVQGFSSNQYIKLLLDNGANVNAQNNEGKTPLLCALPIGTQKT